MSSVEKENEPETEKGSWHKFSQEVTMHGMKNVYLTEISLVRRIIWLFLLVACLSYCTFACYLFMDDYVKRVVSTKVQMIKADDLKFPTVTICNRNLVTLSTINYTADTLNVPDMYEILRDLYQDKSILPPPQGKYDWESPELTGLASLTRDQTYTLFEMAAPQFDITMISCDLGGVYTPCEDVFTTVITEGAPSMWCTNQKINACIQLIRNFNQLIKSGAETEFNSDGKFNATSAGVTGGISLALYADVMEYTMGPLSHAEGFSITLHDSAEAPLVNELGVGIRPGAQTSLMLKKSQTIREPPPADDGRADCEDTENLENILEYYSTYTYSGCVTECKTRYVLDKCACRDVLQPALNKSRVCLIREMLECSVPASRLFLKDKDGMAACGCREACTTVEYQAHVSTFHFPSHSLVLSQNITPGVVSVLEQNVALIDLYFGELSYQQILEEVTYDIFDAIASVGGTLGVGIGASLLTLFEFLEFGVIQFISLFSKRAATRKVHPGAN